METRETRYERKDLVFDYLRSGVGTLLVGTPVVFANVGLYLWLFLAAIVLIFLVYGLRTFNRQMTVVYFNEQEITVRSFIGTDTLAWEQMDVVNLRYFSTRRDQQDGWMHLILGYQGKKIRIDSGLEDFNEIAGLVYKHGLKNQVTFKDHTISNFAALGFGDASDAGPPIKRPSAEDLRR